MTTEIQEYKCPSCDHQLGKQEFLLVCEKIQKRNDEIIKQRLNQKEESKETKEIEAEPKKFYDQKK